MRINTNVSSLTAQEASQNTSKRITSSLEKLSTGLRINKASDDASGLSIADKLRTQATSINQGIANGNSAVSLLQIADKSMAEQSNILDTIKAKLIQANTDTTSSDGRESIRKDISKLLEQLDNIAEQTNYNGNVLLQASASDTRSSSALSFQIGETSRDTISNASIQSNTSGLGSKTSYGTGSTLTASQTKLITSDTAVTFKAANEGTENVTIDGDVDELVLAVGAQISGVDVNTAAKLNTLVGSGKASLSSGTYTIGNTAQTLDLNDVNSVKATINTPKSESFTATSFATGQLIDVKGISLTSGSDLKTSLEDANLFSKVTTGVYLAIKGGSIDTLKTGESFKLMSTKDVQSGTNATTEFNAGDIIKVNSKVTGGLLDKTLGDTNSFKANVDGSYTVIKDYTAGQLRLMATESISITNGNAVSIAGASSGHVAAGLTIGDLKYNPGGNTASGVNAFQSSGDFTNIQLGSKNATGTPLYAAGEDTLSFKVTASGQALGAEVSFSYKVGDIISNINDIKTSGADSLSSGVYSSDNFVLVSTGKYQAVASGTLKMGHTDNIEVTRLIGGVANSTTTAFSGTVSDKKIDLTDQSISFTAGSAVNVTNNSANPLAFSSTTEMTNGKQSLSAISNLGEGELTAKLSSDFQGVIDDAITKLNGYRGDVGSTQNQVESAVRNLMTQATNVKAAESIIRDVDYAQESANFNKQNIISQAGSYAISQANTVQQNVLRLLQ